MPKNPRKEKNIYPKFLSQIIKKRIEDKKEEKMFKKAIMTAMGVP